MGVCCVEHPFNVVNPVVGDGRSKQKPLWTVTRWGLGSLYTCLDQHIHDKRIAI